MDFFKSVFSDEPVPLRSDPRLDSDPDDHTEEHTPNLDPDSDSEPKSDLSSAWSFGGLLKTLTVKSESVIETYRKDLQEFSTGLKKELEVAQGSLDEIGTTVINGTAQIINQGKEAILAVDIDNPNHGSVQNRSFDSRKYSRFESQVRAVQSDLGTYCEEPEDLSDYRKWKLGFCLEEKSEEMEGLYEENGDMESVYRRVVNGIVDHETFWCRYFYKVYKLKQAEDLRVKPVNRVILTEEEELTWDVDDSDDEESSEMVKKSPGDDVEDEKEMDGKGSLESEESSEMVKDEKSQVAGQNVDWNSTVHESDEDVSEVDSSGGKDSDQFGKMDNADDAEVVEDTGKSADDKEGHSRKSNEDEKKAIAVEVNPDHGRESSKRIVYSVR